jgi:DNA-binding beta-propeller fold protein YncE
MAVVAIQISFFCRHRSPAFICHGATKMVFIRSNIHSFRFLLLSSLDLDSSPDSIGIGTVTNKLFISDSLSNSVSAINLTDNNEKRRVTTIPVGLFPTDIIFSPKSDSMYVLNQGSDSITEINASTTKSLARLVFFCHTY